MSEVQSKDAGFASGALATKQAQSDYMSATQMGKTLEAVTSHRPARLEFDDLVHDGRMGAGLSARIFDRRRHGSQFLSHDELVDLGADKPATIPATIFQQIQLLRSPWLRAVSSGERNLVLLDARPLQLTQANGTKRHAAAITRSVAKALPRGYELALLTQPRLPPPPDEILALASVLWRPALMTQVKVFVQLATMFDPVDTLDIDLLRAPWISRISVFLDNIAGIYPAHFIGESYSFWNHQLGVEKLKSTRVVMSLGETSQREAQSLWASLPSSEPRPIFTISSCVSGIPSRTAQSGAPREPGKYVVFGNQLPHKNLALPAAALGALSAGTSRKLTFTFVSTLPVAQETALRELKDAPVLELKQSETALSFAAHVTDEALNRLVLSAQAVIVPSLHEGFSLPVVESIEQGIPVLLSRIPAHQELLPEGPWFFDPRDVGSLLEAIEHHQTAGSSWAEQQAKGLAERYDPGTLDQRVCEALMSCLEFDGPSHEISPLDGESMTENGVSRHAAQNLPGAGHEVLRATDASLIRSKLLRHHGSDERLLQAVATPEPFSQENHDALVAVFHKSRSWRVGRLISAPYRALRNMLRRQTL
jgi:hypothetical protein